MAPPFKPTERIAGETFHQYLDRARDVVRQAAAERAAASPEPRPAPSDTSQLAASAAATARAPTPRPPETADAAREARRRGVSAAIARDEEPLGKFQSVSAALPASTQAAAGLRVERLRILKSDVPDSLPRETPKAAFMARVRAAAKGITGQGVSERCVEAAAEACVVLEKDRGFAWAGLKAFETVSGYCARHIWRALRWLESMGLIDAMHVPYREGDEWWRDANIYVPTMDAEPAPLPADIDAADPVLPASASRALGGASRLAALFGLVLRAGGLNTSPASNYRTRPAPA